MTDLTVREMVLYKHGVGFFVRQGEIEGTEATLTFRAEEVNDILKSLAVFDRAGGQVYGVHYQTPMDKAHRLANTSIRLGNKNSITQLFQQLRGRDVNLMVENNQGNSIPFSGRVIGTEEQVKADNTTLYYVSIMSSDGATHIFPFDSIRQFTIRDTQSKEDLTYFLDTSMTEDNRRGVTIRMSEGKHDLVVNYVAPSPTWRVSYRLVAESEEDGTTGTALLQGWGLFDNRLEEDLNDVHVTLVAGQPISFIYNLYASKIPERPMIEDEARVVQAPVEYGAEKIRGKEDPTVYMSSSYDQFDDFDEDDGVLFKKLSAVSSEELAESTHIDTSAKGTGETFQYSVNAPVTVKRGESALVPILSHTVNYELELLYNKAKLPDHPVASLRFANETGLTLERGPVTLVEDGDYKGEAIIPYTKDHNVVYVPYAVELGVMVSEDISRKIELHGLTIEDKFLKHQKYNYVVTTFTIQNSTHEDKMITIETPTETDYDLFDTPVPDTITLNEQRWTISVPAGEVVEFVKKSRQVRWQSYEVRDIENYQLKTYLENKYIDNKLVAHLRDIFEAEQSIASMKSQIADLESDTWILYDKQTQFRENMGSLGTEGQEGALRQRVVAQLEASQDRLEAIEKETADLKQSIEDTEVRITQMIAELGEKYGAES